MATSNEIQMSTIEVNEQGRAGPVDETPRNQSTELLRGLKARQVAMIALGGAIGTGLIIGTGTALADGG
jgi:yeast amino acid transporter